MPQYNKDTTGTELVHEFANEIKGKVILTTGVSPKGLGAIFVETIASAQPALLILAGRSINKSQQTADTITAAHPNVQVRVLKLDLSSLKGAREAAETVNSWDDVPHIDVLVNNAGIMAVDFALSPDGYESQFATNHLGPFLFTNLIVKKLLASTSPRVVVVSSNGHRVSPIRFGDYNFHNGESYDRWRAYGQSKTANMLLAFSLASKLGPKNLQAFSLHPGVIATNLGDHVQWETEMDKLHTVDKQMGNKEGWEEFVFKSADAGVATHILAAFSPNIKAHNGTYLQDAHVVEPWDDAYKVWARDSIEAEKLWKLSEKLVGEEFSY